MIGTVLALLQDQRGYNARGLLCSSETCCAIEGRKWRRAAWGRFMPTSTKYAEMYDRTRRTLK